MKLYLVVGHRHTRKASVARALTGGVGRSVRDVQPETGGSPFGLYVRCNALQEAKLSPAAFISEAQARRCTAVLACLWPQADPMAPQQHPDAAQYLAAFRAAGWVLQKVAVLGQDAGGFKGAQTLHLPFASTQPVNATARAVRQHFRWA